MSVLLENIQYRYATTWDIILMFIGTACTFVKALGTPGLIIVYGEFTTLLVDRTLGYGTSSKTILLSIFGGGKILYVNINQRKINVVSSACVRMQNKRQYSDDLFSHKMYRLDVGVKKFKIQIHFYRKSPCQNVVLLYFQRIISKKWSKTTVYLDFLMVIRHFTIFTAKFIPCISCEQFVRS